MKGFMEKVVFSFERQGGVWCTEIRNRKKIVTSGICSTKKGKSRACRAGRQCGTSSSRTCHTWG